MAIDDVLYDVSLQHVDAQQKLKNAVVLANAARKLALSLDPIQTSRLSEMAPHSPAVSSSEKSVLSAHHRQKLITRVTDTRAIFHSSFPNDSRQSNNNRQSLGELRTKKPFHYASSLSSTTTSDEPSAATAEHALDAITRAVQAQAAYNNAVVHLPPRGRIGKSDRKMAVSSPLRKMLATRFVTEKLQEGINLSCRLV
ncbi:hypothetical protein BROUX41_003908 [Berkeleyomyces rouxiae]|uniref:uncharacterized protein n=1 Tax=Berkeleyomyces rouxiae TaxID=2035830 RepID=UPI003B7CB259